MAMKFYMTPGSCSTGIHILLEEIGLVFEAHIIDLLAGEQDQAWYRQINPKGTIPTLDTGTGLILTDYQSIAWWLASHHPRRRLLPLGIDQQAKALELMSYAVNTLHGQGFARIFVPASFAASPDHHEEVESKGRDIVTTAFQVVEASLAESGFAFEAFSIADASLFYVEFWADRVGLELPPKCRGHFEQVLRRPAVRQVLSEEGYGSIYSR